MVLEANLPLILQAAFIASASPGPATLAIAGTSMTSGRSSDLPIASGITVESVIWSVAAALGLGTIMLAQCLGVRDDPLRGSGLSHVSCLQICAIRTVSQKGTDGNR